MLICNIFKYVYLDLSCWARLYIHLDIHLHSYFLTVPALVITASIYISPGAKEKELNIFYICPIYSDISRLSLFCSIVSIQLPVGILPFHTRESLRHIFGFDILDSPKSNVKMHRQRKKNKFFYILMAVVSVLLIVNHELITSFNYIDISAIDQSFWISSPDNNSMVGLTCVVFDL